MKRTMFSMCSIATLMLACTGLDKPAAIVAEAPPRDTALIDSVPTCQTCRISIMDSVVLGSANDALIAVRPPGFLRDSKGRHYLTFNGWSKQPILVYDSTGKYVGHVGEYGRGPGEYEMTLTETLDSTDSLYVFEFGGIGQVFAPDGKYVRRANYKRYPPFAVVGQATTRVLAIRNGGGASEGGQQYVLRHNGDGRITDSFPVFSPSSGIAMRVSSDDKAPRKFTAIIPSDGFAAPDGSVWTLAQTNYRLEQHDPDGVARKLFGVLASGSPPPAMTADDVKQRAAMNDPIPIWARTRSDKTERTLNPHRWVDISADGLLWVNRQIPAPAWDTVAPLRKFAGAEAPHEEVIASEVADRLYHTVIEIIDPRVGRLLARIELPFKGERVRPGFIGRVTANDDGLLLPTVYRLQFSRQ